MQAQVTNIQSICAGSYLLLACAPVGATTLTLLSAATYSEVFQDTGAFEDQGHVSNGAAWYFDPNYSWGFANAGDSLTLNECDVNDCGGGGADRLCWHTVNSAGGFRCGNTCFLNGANDWARYIYSAP